MNRTVWHKLIASVVLGGVCYGGVAGFKAWTASQPPKIDARFAARSLGDPRAAVWVIEYMDFQCESCAATSKAFAKFIERHPGLVYLQARFHPLTKKHRYALKSAIYAECAAAQGRFWPFQDLLFEKQVEWSASDAPDDLFTGYALTAGLDSARMSACVADPATKERVMKEKEEGLDLGVSATPTFFVNGKKIVGAEAVNQEMKSLFQEKPRE